MNAGWSNRRRGLVWHWYSAVRASRRPTDWSSYLRRHAWSSRTAIPTTPRSPTSSCGTAGIPSSTNRSTKATTSTCTITCCTSGTVTATRTSTSALTVVLPLGTRRRGIRLVWRGTDFLRLRARISVVEMQDTVLWRDAPSRADLKRYLTHALALVYVSTYEGFGMPLIEAMQCRTPVIAANTSCLPEIGADVADLRGSNLGRVDQQWHGAGARSGRHAAVLDSGYRVCERFRLGRFCGHTCVVV